MSSSEPTGCLLPQFHVLQDGIPGDLWCAQTLPVFGVILNDSGVVPVMLLPNGDGTFSLSTDYALPFPGG